MDIMCELRKEDNCVSARVARSLAATKKVYFVKHGEDDVLFWKKGICRPCGPESKQDLLTHVDICRHQVVDPLSDEQTCKLTHS
jgi:hypothetical protein